MISERIDSANEIEEYIDDVYSEINFIDKASKEW